MKVTPWGAATTGGALGMPYDASAVPSTTMECARSSPSTEGRSTVVAAAGVPVTVPSTMTGYVTESDACPWVRMSAQVTRSAPEVGASESTGVGWASRWITTGSAVKAPMLPPASTLMLAEHVAPRRSRPCGAGTG